jgi:hypothetical protein
VFGILEEKILEEGAKEEGQREKRAAVAKPATLFETCTMKR